MGWAEFMLLAEAIVAELQPSLGEGWVDLVQGEVGAGELFAAMDDALQGAVMGCVAVTDGLVERVQRVIDGLPTADPDRDRLSGWLDMLEHVPGA